MRPRSLALAAALALLPAALAAQPNPCAPKPGLRSHMLRVVAKEEPKPPQPVRAAPERPKPPATRTVAQAPKPPERGCEAPKAMTRVWREELGRLAFGDERDDRAVARGFDPPFALRVPE